jgi:hypothetical protein
MGRYMSRYTPIAVTGVTSVTKPQESLIQQRITRNVILLQTPLRHVGGYLYPPDA